MPLRTGAIVQALGGDLFGDADRCITRLAPLESAQPSELSFLVSPKLVHLLGSTQAGCVIVGPTLADAARARGDCIVADDPHLYFACLTQLWRRLHGGGPRPGVHPSAVVEEGAFIDPSASVGALCFIGRGAHVGADTVIRERVTVGADCVIGAHCTVGGAGMILGHLTIADHVHISSASIVTRSIARPGHYTGFFPLDDNESWEKNAATLKHIHRLRERIKHLEQTLSAQGSHT